MNQVHKALVGIDIENEAGVEIGPLTRPLVRKEQGEIYYIDRTTTAELKREFQLSGSHIDTSKIVDVDFVWGSQTLSQCVSGRHFDYCIASHVIEHVPDLISWLAEVEEILKPGGLLSLIVPDRRYTFDFLRAPSTIAEAVEAYIMKLRKPNYRQVFDHFANYAEIDTSRIWHDENYKGKITPSLSLARARDAAEESLGRYIDAHCWVFTTETFRKLFAQIRELGLSSFSVDRFVEPEIGHNEFFVGLQKTAERDLPLSQKAVEISE